MPSVQARKKPSEKTLVAPVPTAAPLRATAWRYVALYASIFVVLLVVYWPALHGGMLWDDDAHLTRPELKPLAGLWRIWFEPGATQQYYPVVHSAFWLMSHLVGDATVWYHILNVALHAASAVLVVVILETLGVPGAVCAAAFFAIHPVHVESVAWMTELKNTLSGVFFLSALLVYLRFDDTRSIRTYACAFALFLLALLSKSVTATLPAVLLALFWLRRGRLDLRRDVGPLVPFFCVGAVMGLVTALVERTFIGATGAGFELSAIQRCLVAGRAVCFYLSKLLWPTHLMFVYPRWEPNGMEVWQYLFPLAVLIALAVSWRIRAWSRAPFAALLMFCFALGPALGFVNVFPFRYSFVADHFQYLASLPILAFGVASIYWALQTRLSSLAISSILIGLVGGPLAILARAQSREYADARTLYVETIEQNPRAWLAYNNLAMLDLAGTPTTTDLNHALAGFETALAIAPNEPTLRFNVGTALHRLKRHQEALVHLRLAVSVDPTYADAWGNLGAALQQLDRPAEAIEPYRRALNLKPGLDWVRYNLSAVLLQVGRVDDAAAEIENTPTTPATSVHRLAIAETFLARQQYPRAIDEYRRALQGGPLPADALNHLGYALLQEKRPAEAEQSLRFAVAMQPGSSAIQSNLGNALQQLGRTPEALAAYRLALALPQGSLRPETHNDFGVALARAGQLDEAIGHFREAVRLDPAYIAAQQNLAKALQVKGGG